MQPPPPAGRAGPRPDPEFLADPFPVARLPSDFPLDDHQRLVVNPFLAVVALIAWAWITRQLFRSSFPPLALIPTLFLIELPFAVHVHCFDCGQTERFARWRRHACPKAVLRARLDRPRWFRWPTARTQLVVWCYVLGAVALLLAVVGVGVSFARQP